MQPVDEAAANCTQCTGIGLDHWPAVDDGDILRMVDANETMHEIESIPFLKQPLHMIVIYTITYSAVFILGNGRRSCLSSFNDSFSHIFLVDQI
jgi:hypothetical protein